MTPAERRLQEVEELARQHGVTLADIFSKQRLPIIVTAKRHIVRHFQNKDMGPSEISRILKCHHSSIHHLLTTEGRWKPKLKIQRRGYIRKTVAASNQASPL